MGPRWGLGGARDPRGRCLFPLPPAGTTPATPLWYCLCHSGPPPLPLWLLTAWPGGAAWCRAALGRGLVVVWLYERPGLAFPYPLRVHPVRCLPAAWLHSSVATSEPLVGRSGKSIDRSESGRRWRYQSSWSWTVTSTLATQLARLYMRSQQRPAPRHQAAFGAAPEPMSETVRLRRLRERSG